MSSLVFRITGDPGSFKAAMSDVSNSLDAAGRKAQSVSHQMASLGSTLSIGLTLPVVAAGTAFVKAAADMEKLNKGLASVMGSAAVGAAEMKKLQDAAKLPGLGLEGAVQGSIRLQVLGKTADQSRKIMAELGNAIALVGGGKDDFAEVTRQLGQMLSVGKVTKENLDTITERIPQISKIMIDTWGPQSVGDPAKFFEKAGISSREFVDIIVSKLGEGARAGDTFANKLGNLEEAIKLASARIGDKMLPALEKLLPKLEGLAIGAADAVDAFLKMPEPIKNAAIALGLLTIAAGPVIGVVTKVVGAIGAIEGVAGAAGVALGALFGGTVIAMITQTMTAIDQLNARYADLKKARDAVASGKADPVSGLTESGQELGKFKIDLKQFETGLGLFGEAAKKAEEPVKKLGEAIKATNVIVADSVSESKFEKLNRLFVDGKISIEAYKKEQEKLTAVMKDGKMEGDKLSTTSLVYVESLERVKTAVGKVKDVMFEYFAAGTPIGTQLETHRSKFDALAVSADGLGTSLHAAGIELDRLSKIPPPQISIDPSKFGRVGVAGANNAGRVLGIETDNQRQQRIAEAQEAFDDIKAANARGAATGNDVIAAQQALKKAIEGTGNAAKASGKKQTDALQQVSLVITDLSRGITDVLFKGGKLGDMFKSVAMQAAQSITRLLIEGALAKLATKLFDIGGIMGKVFGGAGGAGGTIFSAAAGGGASAAGSIAAGAASAGGGVASTVGNIGGAVASAGITAIVGAVSGVVNAVSGIIGNVQMAHMNTALGRIEESTRYMKIWTGEQSQSILWSVQTTAERLLYTNTALDTIGRFSSEMLGNLQQINKGGGMGGGAVINNYFDGANLFSRNAMQELAEELARILKQQGL